MQAINGYIEDGQFIPNEMVKLPKRIQVVLLFNEADLDNNKTETAHAKAWREFFNKVNASDEKVPDTFEKVDFKREVEL
jgi:DNA/RNA-binding domain of Phe-tRNA-synthetase-like protein